MAEIFGDSLGDPRVSIREADVTEIIRTHRSKFDAILLDVDNGPEGLTRKANDALYSSAGLKAAHTALRPGGVLAVWSSGPNPVFAKRLRGAGFDVNEVNIRATGKRRRRAPCHLDRDERKNNVKPPSPPRRARACVDRVDDLRPHRDRQRVAHAFDHQQLCAGDRGRGVLAAFGADQRIDGAVNHQRRRLH